ncbi:MAG: DUF5060 domain-containing protein [Planctomycetota bacterium]
MLGLALCLAPAAAQTVVDLEDGRDAWKPIQINYTGAENFTELNGTNPFLDRRLDVTFTRIDGLGNPIGQSYTVPGFFNADGNALTTHATSGTQWAARFTPDQAGTWRYTTSFRTGQNVAVADSLNAGSAGDANLNGKTGTFTVAPRDASAEGFLSKGRLSPTNTHYLQTQGDGKYWIKTGADSPENLLGYAGFDNTFSSNTRGPDYGNTFPTATRYLHRYPDHVQDWNPGDPTFSSNNPAGNEPGAQDGKGLIGALNYLGGQGVNSVYFLPMNIGGDGRDTSPFADPNINNNGNANNNNVRYDVSKLEQWESVFAHAQRQGIALNVVLNEAETPNKQELDNATLGNERKLFHRELLARFGHHNAMTFIMSEEYNRTRNGPGELSPETVLDFAEHLSSLDAYDRSVAVHNGNYGDWPNNTLFPGQHSNDSSVGTINEQIPFFGEDDIDTVSFQNYNERNIGNFVEELRQRTAAAGKPLAIMVDEPESLFRPDDNASLTADEVRKEMIYDILFSGGGVEWFMRRGDQSQEDFREYEQVWRESAIARKFMEDHLPFWEMTPDDDLVDGADADFGGAEVFAKHGEVYAIYLPDASNDDNAGGPPTLDLTAFDGDVFSLRWFDPRTGEFVGDPVELLGGGLASLGLPPDGGAPLTNDWVALVTIPEPSALLLLTPVTTALITCRPKHH